MKAAVIHQFGAPVTVEDLRVDPPGPGEIKVRVAATGVCHSDLHLRNGQFPVYRLPLVPGHESAGVVTEVGVGVTDLEPGDHVITSLISYCGHCWHCAHDEPYLCSDIENRYGTGLDRKPRLHLNGSAAYQGFNAGTFAEEAVLSRNAAVKVDKDVPLELAALLGCAVATGVGAVLNTVALPEGSTVAVVGCGGVGLNVIQGARIARASKIIAVDRVASKLDAARTMGATHFVDSSADEGHTPVWDATDGVGADYVFEAIGDHRTQQLSLRMIRRGGTSVFIGMAPILESMKIMPGVMTVFGQRIVGCYMGSISPQRDLPKLVDLWRSGDLLLEELVSHRTDLDGVEEALVALGSGNVLRTIVAP